MIAGLVVIGWCGLACYLLAGRLHVWMPGGAPWWFQAAGAARMLATVLLALWVLPGAVAAYYGQEPAVYRFNVCYDEAEDPAGECSP